MLRSQLLNCQLSFSVNKQTNKQRSQEHFSQEHYMHFPSSQSQHVAFWVARQPWHHALLMRWRIGNTVHCLLKEYYSSPQRENTKKQKKIWNGLGSGQRANVHPCTFEGEVIWAPSRLAFERVFYRMTIKKSFILWAESFTFRRYWRDL